MSLSEGVNHRKKASVKVLNGMKSETSYSDGEDRKTRVRRTYSVAKAEEIRDGDRIVRGSQSDKPIHVARDSLLSWSSGFDRYEGFINWGALILILGGLRLFLENVLKYGIRISPLHMGQWLLEENQGGSYYHTLLYLFLANFHFLIVYMLEKLMSKNALPVKVGTTMHIIHLITIVCIPVVLLRFWGNQFSLIGRTIICCVNAIAFTKLWSYIQVNYWCRNALKNRKLTAFRKRSKSFRTLHENDSGEEDVAESSFSSYQPVEYPNNLTLKDLYYFLAAPTLCYELNFPRSHSIRKQFLLRRLLEMFVLSNLLLGLFQQWIIPSVRNSFKPFSDMDYIRCTERILKLAVPNHLLWLIWFYSFFHSFLNTTGELLKFGDRNFYQDWWNAKDVGTFWRLWNLPVHKWCVRHLFVPMVKHGYSKQSASLVVFALSAFFHEYLVSIPLNMYKISVFMGMLCQVPLVNISMYLGKKYGDRIGNLIVWSSLILGQPIGIMVYYHDYIITNFSEFSLTL